MFRLHTGLAACTLGALLLALGAAPALAGPPAVRTLKVTPKRPQTTETLHVSFIAGKLRRDQRYDVGISVLGSSLGGGLDRCVSNYSMRVRGIRRAGRRVEVNLSPVGAGGNGRFCDGDATVAVTRVDVEARSTLLATRKVRLTRDPRDPPGMYGAPVLEATSTPVRVDVLDGSALLVQAPGRPDRTIPVGGSLRGELPSKFPPNSDLAIQLSSGTLGLRSVVADELCAGSTYVTELPLVAPPATLLLNAKGGATFTPVLGVSATALAGCASPLAGTTPFPLAGKVGAAGLQDVLLSGSVADVRIADGVAATVTANLRVKIDLSGQ